MMPQSVHEESGLSVSGDVRVSRMSKVLLLQLCTLRAHTCSATSSCFGMLWGFGVCFDWSLSRLCSRQILLSPPGHILFAGVDPSLSYVAFLAGVGLQHALPDPADPCAEV